MEEIFEAMANHPVASFFFGWFCILIVGAIGQTVIQVAKIMKNKED